MSNVRVIPRLDIKGPNVVKGIQFDGFRVLGTAEMFAEIYQEAGADEIIYQDTVASLYQREVQLDVVKRVARKLWVPLTVAGGIRSTSDIREVLRAGADKVAINTGAVADPAFLRQAVRMFGSQCIVSSIEAHRHPDGTFELWTDYGRQPTGLNAYAWAQRVVELGVGEIMLTSIDREGTGRGYDVELVSHFATTLPVPIIACGGAGSKRDLATIAKLGFADAVSAASVFHHFYADANHAAVALEGRYNLRMGAEVDTGNVDFLHHGFGGFDKLRVEPTSIADAKMEMNNQGVEVRTLMEWKPGHG
jgi:cyclase